MEKGSKPKKVAYFLFEGDTEEFFYKSIINTFVKKTIKRKYKNLKSGTGINKEVASNVACFLNENPNTIVYVYVFIDREGLRTKIPEFNAKAIVKELSKHFNTKLIGRIEKVEAIRMIESWFFYDLEGICKYIDLPYNKSVQAKYCNPELYGHAQLNALFQKGAKGRRYKKGQQDFLEQLNKQIIYEKCEELSTKIQLINTDFST